MNTCAGPYIMDGKHREKKSRSRGCGVEPAVEVQGIGQYAKSLRKIDKASAKNLRLALNQAGGVVVDYIKKGMPSKTGGARSTVKAKSTADTVKVSEGSKRRAYVPWLDFGGRVGKRHSVRRLYIQEGRYLYAALSDNTVKAEFISALERAIVGTLADAGLEPD